MLYYKCKIIMVLYIVRVLMYIQLIDIRGHFNMINGYGMIINYVRNLNVNKIIIISILKYLVTMEHSMISHK